MSLHRLLQQLHCDLAGHDLPLHNTLLDQLAVFGIRVLPLLSQQLACTQVHKLKPLLYLTALSALARPWTSQYKYHQRFALHLFKQLIIKIN